MDPDVATIITNPISRMVYQMSAVRSKNSKITSGAVKAKSITSWLNPLILGQHFVVIMGTHVCPDPLTHLFFLCRKP